MSVTVASLAGTTGLGSTRQVVQLQNGDLWAFGYTSTQTLSTWYSQDGGDTWTAGATHALSHAHNSEGRNLGVGYKRIGSTDVVHIGLGYKSGSNVGVNTIRATISGTTITFHTSETSLGAATADGGGLYWSGFGLEFDSNNKVHLQHGWTNGGNGDVNSDDSTADAGSAEQMTAVSYTGHVAGSDNSDEVRSFYCVDLGSGNAGIIFDDGSDPVTCAGLTWDTWNGSSWTTNPTLTHQVTGTVSNFDKNDWGAVGVSTTDVHAVYRDADTGYLVHRRYNGTSWGDGQTIPTQSSIAGSGVALTTDGTSVWLIVIADDASNTVTRVQWSPATANGIADLWDTNWQIVEGFAGTRSFVGCCRDVVNTTGVAYWTEGASLVVGIFAALPPIDPNGVWIQSNQGSSSASSSTFAVAFTTQNVVAGNRIVVDIAEWTAVATTVTSVTDSAGNVYVKDNDGVLSDGTHGSTWSAPITVGGGTKPTVTAHASAATSEWAMWVHEYGSLLGASSGYLDGTNKNLSGAAPSPITSGASTPVPGAAGEIAHGFYFDGGNGITSIGVSGGWTQRGNSIQGSSTTAEGATSDQLTTAGTGSNASFTLSNTGSPGGCLVTVYKTSGAVGGLRPYAFTRAPIGPFNPQFQTYWQAVPPAALGGTTFPVTLSVDTNSGISLLKSVSKPLSVASTSSVSLQRQVGKQLSVATSSAASLVKAVSKILSQATTSAVSLSTARVKLVLLSVATTSSVTLTKQVGKTLSVASASSASLVKQVGKVLAKASSSSVTLTAIRTKLVTLSVATSSSVSMVRQVGKSLNVATSSQVMLAKRITKTLSVASSSILALAKLVGKQINTSTASQAVLTAVKIAGTPLTTLRERISGARRSAMFSALRGVIGPSVNRPDSGSSATRSDANPGVARPDDDISSTRRSS